MRLKLTLQHPPNQVLPINYQYLISSWIYRTLSNANSDYATRLHEQGYDFAGKTYKLFTFSTLQPKWFDLDKRAKTFTLAKSPTELTLSFCMEEALQHFVVGLFKDQRFSLESGQRFKAHFEITGIETLERPVFEQTMRFRTMTPICIKKNVEGKTYPDFLHPDDEGYAELLYQNLLNIGSVSLQQQYPDTQLQVNLDFPLSFKVLSESKSKLWVVKGTDVKGWLYDFEICMPVKCLEVGYFGGFGVSNSALGMGMVRVLKT